MELFDLIIERLENYKLYSNFEMRKFVVPKPSKLNYKVIGNKIRIKLRKDLWITIEGDKIFMVDSYFVLGDSWEKARKELLVSFGGSKGICPVRNCCRWIKRFVEDPNYSIHVLASRLDPLIVADSYVTHEETNKKIYLKINRKRCNMVKKSQIKMLREEGVTVDTSAKEDKSLIPEMRISSRKKVQKFNKKAYADNSRPNLVQGLKAR